MQVDINGTSSTNSEEGFHAPCTRLYPGVSGLWLLRSDPITRDPLRELFLVIDGELHSLGVNLEDETVRLLWDRDSSRVLSYARETLRNQASSISKTLVRPVLPVVRVLVEGREEVLEDVRYMRTENLVTLLSTRPRPCNYLGLDEDNIPVLEEIISSQTSS